MRTLLWGIVLCGASIALGADATTEALARRLEPAIESVSPAGKIVVEVHNVSKKPVRLWQEGNSWGAACWRVLLVGHGRMDTWHQCQLI